MGDSYILSGGDIVAPDSILYAGCIPVRGGIIQDVDSRPVRDYLAAHPEFGDLPIVDCGGRFVIPRLMEMHIHGAFGAGFEQIREGRELLLMAERFRARGISSFVPTILWDETSVRRLVGAIREAALPCEVLPGIYLEGPFVNPAKRGGIGPGQIHQPDTRLLDHIFEVTDGLLRIMTVAPELEGSDRLCSMLEERGVRVAFGHSDLRGITKLPERPFSITHLFNAMSGLDHKDGAEGLANLALSGAARWVELNADGVHVNASAMETAGRCVPKGNLVLTSDAVVSAGLPYGEYRYFGQAVESGPRGVRYRDSGTLIGSSRLGMEIVRSFMEASGAPLCEAVAAMSSTPMELLGMDCARQGGSIVAGAPADLYLWDKSLGTCIPAVSGDSAGTGGSRGTGGSAFESRYTPLLKTRTPEVFL